MFAKLYGLLVFHLAIISIDINCQEKQRELEEWVKISNDMMYNIVIATDKGKQITKGLLFGMKGDSIYLSLNKKTSKDVYSSIASINQPGRLADLITSHISIRAEETCNLLTITKEVFII